MSSLRRRLEEGEGQPSHERWLITYADLITLLMVFFVVLYSMSRSDSVRFVAVTAAIERAFNIGVLSGQDDRSIISSNGDSLIGEGGMGLLQHRLLQIAQLTGASPSVYVGPHPEGLLIRVSGNLLFDSGKADIKPEGLAFLDGLATILASTPHHLRIEGHTDNIPIESVVYPSNWELSTARAVTVLRYLSEFGGMDAGRMSAVGFAEFRPVDTNDTREGRANNRRVDIVVVDVDRTAGAVPLSSEVLPTATTGGSSE